ncbi:MAG: peptidylprolyl isomerase [Pseudomonadota bacterium]|jgi:parvulin-like peptidyl-prolyl isomerase|nr:peptidylprolyl isomerase [Pseudomonadota bacterium]|tara:strand:- start:1108 stop:1956 length:849 start_codon:yes stop_codon:yes gene_type:complete
MNERLQNILLIFGLIIGVFLAANSIVQESNLIEDDWVANVGGVQISKEKYYSQLEGLARDKKNPITERDKNYVLERMIEEELLIIRAKELGLFENNQIVRGSIIQQMIKLIISENYLESVEEETLRKFYEQNIGFFSSASRLRLQQIYFSNLSGDSKERSDEAFEYLKEGASYDEVSKMADQSALTIPNSMMNLSKVREYIGPTLMNLARRLEPGEFSVPMEVAGGHKIIYLFDKELSEPEEFDSIQPKILKEYQRRRDDNSLREYLEDLKGWYEIKRIKEL